MPRGFAWRTYTDDTGGQWSLQVDADYAQEQGRGWPPPPEVVYPPLPRGWLPRRVIGADPTGRRQTAVVASVTAGLWTGASTTFQVTTNDGLIVVVEVTGWMAERAPRRP